MIRHTIYSLTTFAVLLHSLLGCCAHHSHQDHVAESGPSCSQRHYHSRSDDGGHDHHKTAATSELEALSTRLHVPCDHEHPEGPHPCDEPDCQFLTSQRTDEFAAFETLDHNALICFEVDIRSCYQGEQLKSELRGSDCSTSAVAFRVMCQVWRI